MYIKCTDYHKFYNEKGEVIKAKNLSVGTKLEKVPKWPDINGEDDIEYPYTHGLFCADGTDPREYKEIERCDRTIERIIIELPPVKSLAQLSSVGWNG